MWFFEITPSSNIDSQMISEMITRILKNTFVSPIYNFSSAGNTVVHTPSQSTKMEKYLHH